MSNSKMSGNMSGGKVNLECPGISSRWSSNTPSLSAS